jgi:branched-subunit amino acid permease
MKYYFLNFNVIAAIAISNLFNLVCSRSLPVLVYLYPSDILLILHLYASSGRNPPLTLRALPAFEPAKFQLIK